MSSCSQSSQGCSQTPQAKRFDWLLWGSVVVIAVAYITHWLLPEIFAGTGLDAFTAAIFALMNTLWWGLLIGMVMVGLLGSVPREFVVGVLGSGGVRGIVRAAGAGVLLDVCSHGILMVGAKLYERGASTGQVMAFLVASPWNSFSLTVILIALIGFGWTLLFIALSLVISIITGMIFEQLEAKGIIPGNPHALDIPQDFKFWRSLKTELRHIRITPSWLWLIIRDGVKDSGMVVRWILFGVLLAALFRTLITADDFTTYFGPSWMGLWLTLAVATVMEICSEGSLPIAADLLTRAKAPGNGFMFLMAGVATDYTEVMVLKNTTRSWRIALLLPAVTVPQVILLAWLMNQWSV